MVTNGNYYSTSPNINIVIINHIMNFQCTIIEHLQMFVSVTSIQIDRGVDKLTGV